MAPRGRTPVPNRAYRRTRRTLEMVGSFVGCSPPFSKQRNRIDGDNSVLQQLFDPLVELFERDCAFDPLAIDEEGRRRMDPQHLVGELFIGR
jgi:hypothetical protein